jgi:hypothetical protein
MHAGITAHSLQAGPSNASEVLADNPVIFWELNDAFGIGGTFTTDSGPNAFFGQVYGHERYEVDGRLTSGNPTPPILSGGPNGLPGLVNDGGGVYDFPGPDTGSTYNGAHMVQTGQNLLQLISYMSIECWVKLDTFSGGIGQLNDRNHLVHVGPQVDGPSAIYNALWSLTVNSTGHLGGYHEVGVRSPIVTTSATAQLSLNTTHHIVTTRNGLAKTITFWIDGVEYDTVGYPTSYNGGGNQTFMRVAYTGFDSYSRTNGQMDNIAVYNYMLPDARILAHYNSGIA